MRAVIVNPASASGKTAKRWRYIVSQLEQGNEHIEVFLTTKPGDAISLTKICIDDGIKNIIMLGGDGTLGEVITGCLHTKGKTLLRDDIEISLIHQGTGGDMARGLGIPKKTEEAIDVALHGSLKRIDVGVVSFQKMAGVDPIVTPRSDGSYVRAFAANSNVGMGSEVVLKVNGRLKRFGNNGSFAIATVLCLGRNKHRNVTISTQNNEIRSTLDIVDISVCNNRYMGGGMLIAPDAKIDDGLLDAVIVSAASRLRLIRAFPKLYTGRHINDPLVKMIRTSTLNVDIPDGSYTQGVVLDGEPVGCTPATWNVLPKAISIRVPHQNK